jgi:hypothetical protein
MEDGAEDEHNTHSGPLYHRGPGFKVVNSFFLTITTSTKAGLEFLDTTIGKSLAFESPCRWQDIHVFGSWYEFPSI